MKINSSQITQITIPFSGGVFSQSLTEFNDKLFFTTSNDDFNSNNGINSIIGSDNGDRIVCGVNDDRIDRLKGNDTLYGCSGSGIFALELGQTKDTITNFYLGNAKLGSTNGLEFENLTFVGNTVKLRDENLVQLNNINTENLSIRDFVDLQIQTCCEKEIIVADNP